MKYFMLVLKHLMIPKVKMATSLQPFIKRRRACVRTIKPDIKHETFTKRVEIEVV